MEVIKPDWPAADNVHAFCTTRNDGVSTGEYAGLNLALHVEDDAQQVLTNRELLKQQFHLPDEPVWLDQVHGNRAVNAQYIKSKQSSALTDADASFSEAANTICTVMTADCLPILICNRKGTKVAAAHAGWRGLADGVIESTVAALNERHGQLLVWLGPAIGAQAFEVGKEVRDIFIDNQAKSIEAFKENRPGHYLADIYLLAKLRLENMGIRAIYGGEYCTYNDANRFYSFRRDGKTGRQASLIWFE
ncbi:MAG: peptidoglycan editing factor PgeF [endosymbiont of Galathealinum brachiosum]|uniref:Purine nucleoside phosphorylase n=1 Tax=endosymbiont of Galathealinum brachiosum TaxID=2200906 RepID=A0A370DBM5_9GAMM|nr:MAG: peptidoglycan editing factor PgeF [endosymbiont of Galathealinum brachiosum]